MSIRFSEKFWFCKFKQKRTLKFYVLEVSEVDTVDRIFEILDRLPMEQREFAKLVGVSDDTASDWRRRRSASYTKRLAKISEVLGTSVEYLLTGEKKEPAPTPAPDFLIKFNSLTPEGQKEVIAFLNLTPSLFRSGPSSAHLGHGILSILQLF